MLISNGDLLLTTLFSIGLFQLFWLSVVLVRKGLTPSLVRLSMFSLLSIWVLIWPAYDNTQIVLLSLSLFVFPFMFAMQKQNSFARHLRLAWHVPPVKSGQPAPWLMIFLSLMIGTSLFHLAPELGLGLTLSICLAWGFAELFDKTSKGLRLGLANNLQQTLAGHLLFVLLTSLICAWSLQLYHASDWKQFFIATLIVGISGSAARAIIASGWNMPLSTLVMAVVLWLL